MWDLVLQDDGLIRIWFMKEPINIYYAKRLHKWLGKAIAYLESTK